MNSKHWTLGVVLAAAVSLFGLIEANASPFSMFVLSDDLGNRVNGSAPEAPDSDGASSSQDGAESGSDSGGNSNGNSGHGNNEDGVDSDNKGASADQLGGDSSCDGTGECVDDEIDKGDGASSDSKGKGKGDSATGGGEIDEGDAAASDSKGKGKKK